MATKHLSKQSSILILAILSFSDCNINENKSNLYFKKLDAINTLFEKPIVKYIKDYDVLNTENNVLLAFIINEPFRRNMIITNSNIDYVLQNPANFYCIINGIYVFIYSGFEKVLPQPDSTKIFKELPNNLKKMSKTKTSLINYIPIMYSYNIITEKDTFYEIKSNDFMADIYNLTYSKYEGPIFKNNSENP